MIFEPTLENPLNADMFSIYFANHIRQHVCNRSNRLNINASRYDEYESYASYINEPVDVVIRVAEQRGTKPTNAILDDMNLLAVQELNEYYVVRHADS